MYIYAVTTVYHLLEMIAYIYEKEYNDVHNILIIPNALYDKINNFNALKNLFYKIVIMDYNYPFKGENPDNIIYKFEQYMKEQDIDIDGIKEYFIASVVYLPGIYLIQKNIRFTFFEEASGVLSNIKHLENIEQDLNIKRMNYCKKHGLYDGTNQLINKVICNFQHQSPDILKRTNLEHFNVTESLLKLDNITINTIFEIFGVNTKIMENNFETIIFTQHFSNLKIHSLNNHCLIYQLFVDYFFPHNKILFKTHPYDILYYNQLFPNSIVIRDNFPSELLPIITQKREIELSTICSTSVQNLSSYYNRLFYLDFEYGHTDAFLSTHRVYTGLYYVNQINKNGKIFIEGYPTSLFKGFINKIFHNLEIVENIHDADYIFIDDYIDNNYNFLYKIYEMINNKQQIVYINSKSIFLEYDLFYNKIESIKPIVLSKKVNREEYIYQNLEDEIIFIISKSNNLNLEFKMKKKLEHTGITIETTELTKDQIRIKVLEGILEATEKRLLYILEENKKLKEQLGANE